MNWLKGKKINNIYVIASLVIVTKSYLVNVSLRDKLLTIALSESFFWLTIPILFFSIITYMVRRNTFLSWVRMTNYFFIISVLIILITPTSTHGLDFFPIVKETVTIVLASLYSVISLALIIYKSFKKE